MNVWNFTGNLGKDAEVKTLQSGTTICEFSVAVKSGYGDKEKTNWANCVIFGKKAEGGLPAYLKKGTQVAISGELELQEWDGSSGKGSKLAVVVSELDLIGGIGDNASTPQSAPQAAPSAPQAAPQAAPPSQAPMGYYYDTCVEMTEEHANWYIDAGHKKWAKGTKPPA